MKQLLQWALLLMFVPTILPAQEEEPKSMLAELVYIKVKMGSEEKFEAAVLAHNKKYHSSSPYKASLNLIETGEDAGTYVWAQGGFSYSEMDARPGKGEHQKDWAKTIAPFIESYGRTEIWSYNKKLSHRKAGEYALEEIWYLSVSGKDYYRFKAFMAKIQKIMAAKDAPMSVYNNAFGQDNGRDVAIVFPLKNWAEYDNEEWTMKEEFEKEHGANSWNDALSEWDAVVKTNVREVWTEIK
jgi:hypothetical protein